MRWEKTWALVADRARARIVRRLMSSGVGDSDWDDLVLRGVCLSEALLAAMEAGRGPGHRSSRYFRQACERDIRRYAETMVVLLDAHRIAGDFDALVLVAGQSLLHHISSVMPPGLRGITVAAVPIEFPHGLNNDWRRILTESVPMLH